MTLNEDLARYVRLMSEISGDADPSKELRRARALQRLDAEESIDVVSPETGIGRRHLLIWHESP